MSSLFFCYYSVVLFIWLCYYSVGLFICHVVTVWLLLFVVLLQCGYFWFFMLLQCGYFYLFCYYSVGLFICHVVTVWLLLFVKWSRSILILSHDTCAWMSTSMHMYMRNTHTQAAKETNQAHGSCQQTASNGQNTKASFQTVDLLKALGT